MLVLFPLPKWEEQMPALGIQPLAAWCKFLVARVGQGSATLPTQERPSRKILAISILISQERWTQHDQQVHGTMAST